MVKMILLNERLVKWKQFARIVIKEIKASNEPDVR